MSMDTEEGVKGGGTGAPRFEITVGAFNVSINTDGLTWIECNVCGGSWMLPTDYILDLFAAEHLIACIEADILCTRCGNKITLDDLVKLIPESMVPIQDEKDWSLYEEFNRIKAKCRNEHHGTLQKTWDFAKRCVFLGRTTARACLH